ncbi:hypothetical protein SLEP1_g3372 [Rubroshorea leprosula]|uniref:Uncharacterized protein n=1 Tax=Rubroshorea leprosula TaxID=152421 RepID=A0AAV5HSL4_9ROSI|nr:hypothetical protein SLEP1_g3372 [Rubroshorea leprosula]
MVKERQPNNSSFTLRILAIPIPLQCQAVAATVSFTVKFLFWLIILRLGFRFLTSGRYLGVTALSSSSNRVQD